MTGCHARARRRSQRWMLSRTSHVTFRAIVGTWSHRSAVRVTGGSVRGAPRRAARAHGIDRRLDRAAERRADELAFAVEAPPAPCSSLRGAAGQGIIPRSPPARHNPEVPYLTRLLYYEDSTIRDFE